MKDAAVRSVPAMTQVLSLPIRSEPPAGGLPTRRGCPLSDLRDKLRRVGLRPTRQRVSLGWLLFGKGDRHITAEMLFDEATRARVPVSLATVYKDRKSTRLNSSHANISYAVFCLKKKNKIN